MIYLQLFYEFFKTGIFAIGGGLATLPFLYDMSLRTGWYSPEDIANMIAISQSTPGPLGINMAAYAGYLTGGIAGAIIAPCGLIMPSLIIIILIAKALSYFRESKMVQAVFYGLKPASLALITVAWIGVVNLTYHPQALVTAKGAGNPPFFWQGMLLAPLLFAALRKYKLHPIYIILLAGLAGILLKL